MLKTIYSCIITISKKLCEKVRYTNVTSLTDLWAGGEQKNIEIENRVLDEAPWRLSTDIEFMKMIAKVEENGKPLGDVVDIFNGIQTSAERPKPVYWFSKEEVISETAEELIVRRHFHMETHRNGSI